MSSYIPGLHILGTLYTNDTDQLGDYTAFKKWIEQKINAYELSALGDTYHAFPDAGYTGIICLTESHIAFHTWPEFGLLTLDIFLSNFQKENDDKARSLFDECCAFFNCSKIEKTEVRR